MDSRRVSMMKNGIQKFRLFKEKEKINQVTHWDLDYLTKDEIQDLYNRKTGYYRQGDQKRHATGKGGQKFSLLLITIGILLLAGSLYVASLI